MSKTGVEGNQRVFIVEDADKMTAGAANSLLKFFEEPVPGMTVILTATAKNQLLPTILSRAQVITFQSPDRNAVITKLEEGGANSQLARVAGRLTGNVSEAQELLASDDFQDRVNRVFQLLDRLADHDPESLTASLQAILTAQVRLTQNVTFQSATEQLMLKLLEG